MVGAVLSAWAEGSVQKSRRRGAQPAPSTEEFQMANPKNPIDSTGPRSLIGPKPEDPVRPPKLEDARAIRDAVTPGGKRIDSKLPTPGGPKPR